MPEFNTKYLEEVSGGNQQFILEMLQIFLSRTPEAFEILRKSVQEEDWETIGFYAHKLKATYAYVGLEELKKVLIEIEQRAKHKIVTHTLGELIDYLINITQPELEVIQVYKQKIS